MKFTNHASQDFDLVSSTGFCKKHAIYTTND